MAHQFPSRHTVRRSLILTPVGGTFVGLGSLLFGAYPDGVPVLIAYGCILSGFAIWFAIRRGLLGPVYSARDHLRLGERRRMRLTGLLGVLALLAAPIYSTFGSPGPLWVAFAIAPLFGAGALFIVLAVVRLARDPARRGCPGAYDDCRDCDTIVPIVELKETLNQVDEDVLDQWRIDPETGAEVMVDTDRGHVTTHTIDDSGHEVATMYLLANITGAFVQRLIPIVAYEDGARDVPDLSDRMAMERMSMGAEGIRAVRSQVDRTRASAR